jgi:hypothetical protein
VFEIYIKHVAEVRVLYHICVGKPYGRPPLWSSGQSYRLQVEIYIKHVTEVTVLYHI